MAPLNRSPRPPLPPATRLDDARLSCGAPVIEPPFEEQHGHPGRRKNLQVRAAHGGRDSPTVATPSAARRCFPAHPTPGPPPRVGSPTNAVDTLSIRAAKHDSPPPNPPPQPANPHPVDARPPGWCPMEHRVASAPRPAHCAVRHEESPDNDQCVRNEHRRDTRSGQLLAIESNPQTTR